MADWIQNVDKEMEKKGTVGAFTKQATDAGMSVQDFAKKVKDNPTDFSERTRERAQFALNMQQIANKKKMAKGGETDRPQGYNDKLNEDLGTRLGRESSYQQTLKDRRDESKAANKNLGRRAYQSVGTMDKMAKGGYVYRESDDEDATEFLNKKEIMELIEEHNESFETNYKTIEDFNKGEEKANGIRSIEKMAKGGKTQGYDDRDKESIGERNRGKKSQSLESRMRESAGMEKSKGRRKYADVSTMDKGKRKMARGGSVEGKIDRDRYVKLRREKDKEIAKLKKEKGALRKATITKDKCDDKIEKVEAKKVDNTDDNNNQTLLVGGIAGILLGAFFIGR